MAKGLRDVIINDNISLESLESLVERLKFTMKRKEILSRHASPIKQLPNGRWYTRLGGRKIERKSQDDLYTVIMQFYDRKDITINYIFKDYLKRRKDSVAESTWKFDVLYFNEYISNSKFGNTPINKLTLDDGYSFLNHCLCIKSGMTRKYWGNVRSCVNSIIQYGMNVIKSPHDIRRTVLTRLYFAGMPLKKIQEFAGHSTLQQTMDYIRISADEEDMMKYLDALS